MRKFLLGGLLGLTALAQAAVAAEPIRIGAVLSVTGPASSIGDPEAKVLRHFTEKLNADGGVLGRKIELFLYDDESKADKAVTFAKRLIESDKVDLIIGPSLTGNTMAVVPLAEQAQLPLISIAGGGVIVEPPKKWVFKTPHSDRHAAEKVFQDMQKRGISKIALIYGSDGFGKSASAAAKEAAPKYGITILAEEVYAPTDADMTPQLTRIRGLEGVQAVQNLAFGQAGAIVTRNYHQLKMTLPFYQSHGVNTRAFINLAGAEATEGVRLASAALIAPEQLPDNDPQKAMTLAFKKEFEAMAKTEASTFAGHAYDGLMLAVEAIKKAGGTDKAKVRDAIEQTKGFIGTSGPVNMSATDHAGLAIDSIKIIEIRKGDWKMIN